MFLKKVVIIINICIDRIRFFISGVRVIYDNLVWVIYFWNYVKLFSFFGDVFRFIDLDFWLIFYFCMINGDFLVIYGNDCLFLKLIIELIFWEGNIRRIVDFFVVV